jgi:uncharacterized membrane protein
MNELALAYGIGAVSGSRSMLGPALVGTRALPAAAEGVLAAMSVAEMVVDKSAGIPARTAPLPLAGRALTGALAAAGYARPGRRLASALLGAAGAITAAYAFYHLRRLATERFGVSNSVAGLVEDATAIGVGAMLLRAPATR